MVGNPEREEPKGRGLEDYEALVLPHLARLRGYARRRVASPADADDLVQEALLKGWERFSELREPTAIRTWLYRIIGSLARDQHRRRLRRMDLFPLTRLEDAHAELVATQEPGPLEEFLARRSVEALWAALATLPEDFARAVELHDIDGFRYREIAEVEDIPIGTVMSRIARGRRLLAVLLHKSEARPDRSAKERQS